jgi:hypothetical protein
VAKIGRYKAGILKVGALGKVKYALIDGKRSEASKGIKGLCPICDSEMIPKCGEFRVHHWSHKGNRFCDSWWESETDWHRSWKGHFPDDWQEVIHRDGNGEKHIADVKTENGWVLEFQHSFLNPEERRAREAFYAKLVWVVDGLRRMRDKSQFQDALKRAAVVFNRPLILRVTFPEKCRLLKEWLDCSAPVFFDFREPNESKDSVLWLLYPKTNGEVYLSHLARNTFIEFHQDKRFNEMANNIILAIREILASNKQNNSTSNQSINSSPDRFSIFQQRYLARQRKRF